MRLGRVYRKTVSFDRVMISMTGESARDQRQSNSTHLSSRPPFHLQLSKDSKWWIGSVKGSVTSSSITFSFSILSCLWHFSISSLNSFSLIKEESRDWAYLSRTRLSSILSSLEIRELSAALSCSVTFIILLGSVLELALFSACGKKISFLCFLGGLLNIKFEYLLMSLIDQPRWIGNDGSCHFLHSSILI